MKASKNNPDYIERLCKVEAYILQHLSTDLTLESLAEVANFSPYHFHRIFKNMVGEPLIEYVRRTRLEYAALQLKNTNRTISEIAFKLGYENPESFTRAFNKQFNCSPRNFRKEQKVVVQSSIKKMIQKKLADKLLNIAIKKLPTIRVAYLRHQGPYNTVENTWAQLNTLLYKNGINPIGRQMIGIPFDDPYITEGGNIRYHACVELKEDEKVEGSLQIQELPPSLFAMVEHQGSYETMTDTYELLYGLWLLSSDYELADLPLREVYVNTPMNTPKEELITQIYLPIKKF